MNDEPDEVRYVVRREEGWWLSQSVGCSTTWVNIHERDLAMKMSYQEAVIRADRYNLEYCGRPAFVERDTPLATL